MKLSEQVADLQRRVREQAARIAKLEQERRVLLRNLSDSHDIIEQLRAAQVQGATP